MRLLFLYTILYLSIITLPSCWGGEEKPQNLNPTGDGPVSRKQPHIIEDEEPGGLQKPKNKFTDNNNPIEREPSPIVVEDDPDSDVHKIDIEADHREDEPEVIVTPIEDKKKDERPKDVIIEHDEAYENFFFPLENGHKVYEYMTTYDDGRLEEIEYISVHPDPKLEGVVYIFRYDEDYQLSEYTVLQEGEKAYEVNGHYAVSNYLIEGAKTSVFENQMVQRINSVQNFFYPFDKTISKKQNGVGIGSYFKFKYFSFQEYEGKNYITAVFKVDEVRKNLTTHVIDKSQCTVYYAKGVGLIKKVYAEGETDLMEVSSGKAALIQDYYIVKSGDTMYSIAQMCGISTKSLAAYNGMSVNKRLVAGKRMKIKWSFQQFENNYMED